VRMPDRTDWLMTPVMAGLCKYESLTNGAIDLVDVARMNDALMVRAENERRARATAERRNHG
jgi:hypothetical protein